MTTAGRAAPHATTATVAVLTLAAPGITWGGSWALEPRLRVDAEYDTNPQLLGESARGYRSALNLGLPAVWDDGARRLELAPRARLVAGGGPAGSDRDAFGLRSAFLLANDLSTWSATAEWADESTATVEPAAGTLTRQDIPRTTRAVGLEWTRALSERSQASLALSGAEIRYAGGERLGLFDYRDTDVSISLSRALQERRSVQFVAGASRYADPRGERRSSRTSFAQLGIVGQWNELWNYDLLYGWSRTQADRGSSPSGSVYLAQLARRGPRLALDVGASRSFQASGFGTIARSTEASVALSWRHSELVTTTLAARNGRTRDAFGSFALADRRYRSVRAGWSYRATEVWSFDAALDWRRQELGQFGAAGSDATGTAVTLSATRRFGLAPLTEMRP